MDNERRDMVKMQKENEGLQRRVEDLIQETKQLRE